MAVSHAPLRKKSFYPIPIALYIFLKKTEKQINDKQCVFIYFKK